jgi:hypothetical protein
VAAHSRFSASGAHRWLQCHASVRMITSLGDNAESGENEFSREGTLLHGIAAEILEFDAKRRPLSDDLMRRFRALTDEQRDVVDTYRNTVRDACQTSALSDLWIEHKVSLPGLHPEFFGTMDAGVYDPVARKLTCLDLKCGRGVDVEPREPDGSLNPQLGYYVLGMLEELGWRVGVERGISPRHSEAAPIEEIEIVIVQPRLGGVKRTHASVLELEDLARELNAAALAADTVEPKFDPSPKTCKWCPAKAVCPAVRQDVQRRAKIDFGKHHTPDPVEFTPEELAGVLEALPALEGYIEAVRKHAHRVARKTMLPGWKFVGRTGIRRWKDEDGAIAALDACPVSTELYEPPRLKSPAQVEAALKARGYKAADYHLPEFIDRADLGVALVPASDRRPEVKVSADADFEVFNEDD